MKNTVYVVMTIGRTPLDQKPTGNVIGVYKSQKSAREKMIKMSTNLYNSWCNHADVLDTWVFEEENEISLGVWLKSEWVNKQIIHEEFTAKFWIETITLED